MQNPSIQLLKRDKYWGDGQFFTLKDNLNKEIAKTAQAIATIIGFGALPQ